MLKGVTRRNRSKPRRSAWPWGGGGDATARMMDGGRGDATATMIDAVEHEQARLKIHVVRRILRSKLCGDCRVHTRMKTRKQWSKVMVWRVLYMHVTASRALYMWSRNTVVTFQMNSLVVKAHLQDAVNQDLLLLNVQRALVCLRAWRCEAGQGSSRMRVPRTLTLIQSPYALYVGRPASPKGVGLAWTRPF